MPKVFSSCENPLVYQAPVLGADTFGILSKYASEEELHRIYDPVAAKAQEAVDRKFGKK